MIFGFFQLLGYVLCRVIFWVFTDLKVINGQNATKVKGSLIVVCNHKSVLDAPALGVALFGYNPRIAPLRYMSKDPFFYVPIYGQVIYLLGAFRAYKKRGIEKSLLTPTRILKRGGSVMLFPEGHMVTAPDKLGEPRRGAAIMALRADATILPLAITVPSNLNIWRFIFTRPKIKLTVGEAFKLPQGDWQDDKLVSSGSAKIMQEITTLFHTL